MIKNTLLPLSEFTTRRQQFFQQMTDNSIALFSAAKELTRSNDTEFPFCQNKNFYYLTGFNEPDALLVMVKADGSEKSILFCREKNELAEVWHGRRFGPQAAAKTFGFDDSYTNDELAVRLPELLENKTQLLYCIGTDTDFELQVQSWLKVIKSKVKLGKKIPETIVDAAPIVHEMRLIKSDAELDIMRKANVISGNAHRRAMEKTAVGKNEYQIEAEIHHEFARNGARHPAYGTIVAGGDNGNILHYTENEDVLNDNECLLIDAGCELAGYAADITRTFPHNGKFTEAQKVIYQLVLESQELAINAIKPGASFAELNDIVCQHFNKGLHELGILKGDLADIEQENGCKKYFIHGLGHWLGLDVHDVGDYQADENKRQLRPFEPGMIMTIEPGIYIPSNDMAVEEKWRGIAVRIEDNILVTADGFENFTVNAPKTIDEIESVMAAS